jgi:glycosyltransferase involved in cell wall biosynthesis
VKTKARVLYLSPVGERGGAEAMLLQILKYQNRDVFEPLTGFLHDGPLIEEVESLGVPTVLFPATRFRRILTTVRTIRSIRSFLRQERIGLVFGNMAMAHLYGGLAALGTDTQAVWFQHGLPNILSGVDYAAARVPSKLIFVYTEAARRAEARFHPRSRIVPIRGSVDLARFDPMKVSSHALRQELGIEKDALLVACVARLQRWKGQSLFLAAAALVRSSFPTAQFVVVGGTLFDLDKGYARDLVEEAAQVLPPGMVHFLGHRSDLPDILADVDVLVHCPLTPEPFGLVILEAMAMQVPVVATLGGGPDEIVTDGETGVLVAPRDAAALADAIGEVLSDPVGRKAMGVAARRRVEAQFSAEATIREIEGHLEPLMTKS